MTFDQANADKVNRMFGRKVMFIGNECEHWTIGDFVAAARALRQLGFDTMCPKRLNGTQKWYNTVDQLKAEAKAVRAEGVGYVPMSYNYGPQFGLGFVSAECDLLLEMMQAMGDLQPDGIGFAVSDMEAEFNNRVDAAQIYANKMAPSKHLLLITSWADPAYQGWSTVLNVLRGCMNGFIPQIYNDTLDNLERAEIASDLCVLAGLDITPEFGSNHQANIITDCTSRGVKSFWFWEYIPAVGAYRQLTQQLSSLITNTVPVTGGVNPAPIPVPPTPPPVQVHVYVVQDGENLSEIAAKLGISDWHTLYEENKSVIGPNPDLIFAGQKLNY